MKFYNNRLHIEYKLEIDGQSIMNKTKIHTTELKLDEAIHYALTVLTKRHRASEEFKSILSKVNS